MLDILTPRRAGGVASFPPKCPLCRGPVPGQLFERILNSEQRTTYLNLVAMTQLLPGEHVVSCTNCSYFEVRTDQPAIFWCKKCGTPHCCTCKSTLPSIDESDEEAEDEKFLEDQAAIESHLKCAALKTEKELFDKALEAGSSMPCPSCGISGRKVCEYESLVSPLS